MTTSSHATMYLNEEFLINTDSKRVLDASEEKPRDNITKFVKDELRKKIDLNLKYCYLLIAKISVLNDPYENIKQTLFSDFEKIK